MGQQTTMNAHDFENHVVKRLTALRPGWSVRKGPEPFQLTIRRGRAGDLRSTGCSRPGCAGWTRNATAKRSSARR
jgi:hypothetical protein